MFEEAVPTDRSAISDGKQREVRRPRLSFIDHALLRWMDGFLRRRAIGRLRITMPTGATAIIGGDGLPMGPEIAFRSYRAFRLLAMRGAIGFADAYMDGDIDIPDLRAVFDFYLENEPAIVRAFPRLNDTRQGDRRFHVARANTVTGSRRNIADHYDLGNAFYSAWLDPSMLYSSAIFRSAETTLEAAQREKIDQIIDALQLAPSHSLLEIGCGWGALVEAAAGRAARIRAITISEQQLAAARERVARTEFSDRVDVAFEDYRATSGTYDRIVSIEMIEAVGEDNWPLFFETIARRLAPSGVAVIQAITIREEAFEPYRRNPDFIQRHIFPGGMLPTVEIMRNRAGDAGLSFETIERFGASYARTLAEWRTRFVAAWPQIEALGFDERFRRMWLYYLIYCEVGFEQGLIDVGLYRLRRPT